MSFSQYNQDLEVLQFHEAKQNGFFVDIGAGQGIRDSNTYLFEYTHNWTGICVEQNNSMFSLLCENRHRSICSNVIVDSMTYESSYILRDDSGNEVNNVIRQHSTITDILDNNNSPSVIDYISLNMSESSQTAVEILNTIDFTKYTFRLVSLSFSENTSQIQIQELFANNGYEFIKISDGTEWYMPSPTL